MKARGKGALVRWLLPAVLLGSAVACVSTAPPNATLPTASATSAVEPPEAVAPNPSLATATPASDAWALDARFGIAEGFRNAETMAEIGAGWERVVLSWADIQPVGPDDFSWLGRTVPPEKLAGELSRGVKVAGLLQFTPTWAQRDPRNGERSVPTNLNLPFDDPDNYWGQFVYQTVKFYRGRIDEWIIWNEPEFRPTDNGAGGSYTWLGTDAEFARLMKVGYLAAKKANPNAVVSFPGTSYWVEQNAGRAQFYERFLRLVSTDPEARSHNFFHDALALNLYRAPDDLVRVHNVFEQIQARYRVDKPVWLTELNAMPTDDPQAPCAARHAGGPIKTTLSQQAAYAIQALALAAATGYERIGFYQMVDGDACAEPELWGVTRDDGTRRPIANTLRTAIRAFSGFTRARFLPLERPTQRWPVWPSVPTSFTPNWQVYQVIFDLPGGRRVTVLWNGDGTPLRVRVPRHSPAARLLDRLGGTVPLTGDQDGWLVSLPAATAHFSGDPPGYYFIGGDPLLLIEEGVEPSAPVALPRLR